MNLYTVAIEGIPSLLSDMKEPLASFNRDHYETAFRQYYERHVECLEALEQTFNMVVDKEQLIANMAHAFIDEAIHNLDNLPKARMKEDLMRNYNLHMVAYVFPAILFQNGHSSRILAEKILELWKESFPKTNLGISDYETIVKGFKRKFCYITTAVCQVLGKPDDCYELNLLRDYRDSYLMGLADGDFLIQEYYNLAPTIVKHINKRNNKHHIYEQLWNDYIQPCILMIEKKQNQQCKELYIQMVKEMQTQYFFQ